MSETEKITVNLSPVDLGRVDVLVEQGLYSNRTDVIRTGLRNLLDRHGDVIQNVAVKKSFVMGALIMDRQDLLKKKQAGERLSIRIIGVLALSNDIDPDLARETIESIAVRGVFRASQEVKAALADRIH